MKKCLLLLIMFLLPATLLAKELKKVTIQLSWFDQFQFAGYYMAKQKGFYEKYGLDVEIRPFTFGLDVSSEVDEKKVDFGVGRETLILQRVAGKKLVALYALFQESPLVLLAKKESNINKIQDFLKKRIMTTIDDASEVSIKSMILSKGMNLRDLNFIKHSHDIMDLVNNKTDIISAYLSKTPFDLEKLGIEYNVFSPHDYGFDMYSDFLFTHEDKIKNDLSTVLAFKEASIRGWEYAYSNIEETATYMYENYNSQNIPLDALIFEGKVLKKLSYTDSNNLGEIKPEKIQRIFDLYNVMGLAPTKIDLNKFVLYKNIIGKIDFSKDEKEYILNKKEIKMCVVPDLKPYSFIQNGVFEGAGSDYIKLFSEKSKLDYKFIKTKTFDESLEFLKNGKCEIISSFSENDESKEYVNLSKPYTSISFALVTSPDASFIDDISSLKEKEIAISTKYPYSKLLKKNYPNSKFVEMKNPEEAFQKVIDSEVFAYTDLLHSTVTRIQSNYLGKLKISGKLDYSLPISIAVAKNDKILLSIINKSISSITKNETDNITQKWSVIEYKKEFDYKTLYKFGFIFLIIILAVLYRQKVLKNMNKTLKEKVEEKTLALQKVNSELEKKVEKEVSENLRKDILLTKQAKMVAMGEMIQNIAHQWRQPLSIISTGASGLKLQKDLKGHIDDKFLDETLTLIVQTSADLSNTINSLMNFFKSSSRKDLLSSKNVIEKTLKVFDYNRSNGKINIIENIVDVEIISYESELMQILINILNNSREAFDLNKEEERFIFIDAKKVAKTLIIEIKDNAGGISDSVLSKIYEPYFTTKHEYHGTGIGLFMCQEILSKHMDGEIDTKNTSFEYEGKTYKGTLTTITIEI
ncbi:MAG: ABC transporter substrate-binding protein [Halarcobacter sp.]